MDKRNNKLWVFFGTGRYFYKNDDLKGRNKIFGIKDPCYSTAINTIDPTCNTQISSLTDSTSTAHTSVINGWYIDLDCAYDDASCTSEKAPTGYSAERVITDPLAVPTGGVFFTTFSPTADICGYGGNTYLWLVDYKTGGIAPVSARKGKVLIQLSTGEIKEVELEKALVEKKPSGSDIDAPGRRTAAFKGLPPIGQGLSVVVPAEPLKQIIWIWEE
jgi:type IV pilus assembly protein PilY1